MQSRMALEPKFCKYLTQTDFKYPAKTSQAIRQHLNSEIVKVRQVNPFTSKDLPQLDKIHLHGIVLIMGRQMDELIIKNFNFTYLEHFLRLYQLDLAEVLAKNEFYCEVFCLAVSRFLQEIIKSNELGAIISKIKESCIVDMLVSVFEKVKGEERAHRKYSKQKGERVFHPALFDALLGYASAKYIGQFSQQDLSDEHYIERAIRLTAIFIEEVDRQPCFEVLRDFVNFTSHLLIFYEQELRPIKFYEFCLQLHQGLYKAECTASQLIDHEHEKIYFLSIGLYIKTDPLYLNTLLRMVRNLLGLHIKSTILVTHFQVLILIMGEKLFPDLKQKLYDILIENQDKKIQDFIDRIYGELLSSDPDVTNPQTQEFTLALAECGDRKRKEKFVEIYFYNYTKNNKNLAADTINFIVETYLEEPMNLIDFELFIAKECSQLSSLTIKKIHSVVFLKKEKEVMKLLSIILEKRLEGSFRKGKAQEFVHRDWLEAAGNCQEIYELYLCMIVECIGSRTLDINPSLINFSSSIVKIQLSRFSTCLGYYKVLLEKVNKNQVFSKVLFRYMIICQAIFGETLEVDSLKYFSNFFAQVPESEVDEIIILLEYLVRNLKSRSATFLYLQAVLEFERSQVSFNEKKLYDLNFLIVLIEESKYFQISTYSFESLAILYQLTVLIEDQGFQGQAVKLMQRWSGQMNRSECNNLCYLFCFRQIKKIFPYVKEKEVKSNKERVWKLARLIFDLLDFESASEEYAPTMNNRICIEWKQVQHLKDTLHEMKKILKLELDILRNKKMDLSFEVTVFTATSLYSFEVRNGRCFVYERQQAGGKKNLVKEVEVKELKKNPENIHLEVKAGCLSKSKFNVILVVLGQPIEINEEGSIHSIEVVCESKAYFHRVELINLVSGESLKKLESHLTVMKNMEVKIKYLPLIRLTQFLNKFDFERMFCIWGEMLKHFKACDPVEGFKVFIRLSFRLFRQLHTLSNHKSTPREIAVMRAIFTLVKSGFRVFKNSPEIEMGIELSAPKNYAVYMYYLYVSAFLPVEFWNLFTEKTKRGFIEMLREYLMVEGFRNSENQNFEMFEQLCELAEREEVIDILDEIILTHQDNSFLTLKFEHYIFMAGENDKLASSLGILLEGIISCITSDNEDYIQKKVLCKFLIIETKILDIVFGFCSAASKITLIHYIFYNAVKGVTIENENSKITELVSIMKEEEIAQLSVLLIMELKNDSTPKFIKKRLSNSVRRSISSKKYDSALHTELYILIKIWDKLEEQTLEDAIAILTRFLQARLKEDVLVVNPVHYQAENTICTEDYVQFMLSLRENRREELGKHKEDFQTIFDLSYEVMARSSKKKFQRFMSNYLQMAEDSLSMAGYPLQTCHFQKVDELFNHSIMLQYVYELLVLMRNKFSFSMEAQDTLIEAITNYILHFTINVVGNKQVSKPLIYVYPKLIFPKQPTCYEKVGPQLREVEGLRQMQLKGGIYFKLMLITMQLLEVRMNVNFTNLISTLLLKNNRRKSIARRSSNEAQAHKMQRTSLEVQLALVEEEHRDYFQDIEQPLSKEGPEVAEGDLSANLTDFFLMRLCRFLQNNASVLPEQILISYSEIVLGELQHPIISNELLPSNISSLYQILDYQDIHCCKGVISSTPNTANGQFENPFPSTPPRKTSSERNNFMNVINLSHAFEGQEHALSPVRSKRLSIEQAQEAARMTDILETVRKDPKQWGTKCRSEQLDKFFSNRAKAIRFKQLLHVHYLLSRSRREDPQPPISQNMKVKEFSGKHIRSMKVFSSKVDVSILEYSLRKVKKIYPYTSPSRTVIKVIENCLPNMACPITQYVTCKDYSLKRLRHMESFNLRRYEEDLLSEDSLDVTQEVSLQEDHSDLALEEFEDEYKESAESVMHEKYCELVTREGVFFCNWELSVRQLKLTSNVSRPSYEQLKFLIYGTPEDNLIKKNIMVQIVLDEIEEIFYRKFSQMQNSIEIFMVNGTSRFITFYTKQFLSYFMNKLQLQQYGLKVVKDHAKEFAQLGYSDKWADGSISNFDYLMLLNKYSGRTHNDVNQYYVFPWVLKDYQSEKIDLNDPNVYRDLSKPMGALNPQKLKRFKQIYRCNGGSHMYGSHYSTSLFILYYLVRLEPFSTLHRDMQKGFDLPDRLFSSIYQVWDTLMSESSTSDIKEVIPEFYYMPAFLKNMGNIELGEKMSGQVINDVVLPPWAASAEQVIITLRAALESDHVSENLHSWIDLIFGKHQCSEQKNNVFMNFTYQEQIDWKKLMKAPSELKGTVDQITYFGQCPSKLFSKEHKPKKPLDEGKLTFGTRAESQSHTTNSQNGEEHTVSNEWKVIQLGTLNGKFLLEFENLVGKSDLTAEAVIEPRTSNHALKEIVEEPKSNPRRRVEGSKVKKQEEKIKFFKSQLMIDNEIIMTLEMNFTFEQVRVNEMWIVCFGSQGLRVYNWQQELFWKWEKEEEVSCLHLEPTRLIFSTPVGKVGFYNFYDSKLQEVQAIKETFSMEISVLSLPKLPTKNSRNLSEYKVLCVGDGRKVAMLSFAFEDWHNTTSLANMTFINPR